MFFGSSYGFDKTSGALTGAANRLVNSNNTRSVAQTYAAKELYPEDSVSRSNEVLGGNSELYTAALMSRINPANDVLLNKMSLNKARSMNKGTTPIERANVQALKQACVSLVGKEYYFDKKATVEEDHRFDTMDVYYDPKTIAKALESFGNPDPGYYASRMLGRLMDVPDNQAYFNYVDASRKAREAANAIGIRFGINSSPALYLLRHRNKVQIPKGSAQQKAPGAGVAGPNNLSRMVREGRVDPNIYPKYEKREQTESLTKTAGIMSSALKLGGKWLGSTAAMSAMGTWSDEKMRSRYGIADTFMKKMASPKYWAIGAGGVAAPVVGRKLGKYAFKGTGKVASFAGKKINPGGGLEKFGRKLQKMGNRMGKDVPTFDKNKYIEKAVTNVKGDIGAASEKLKYGILHKNGVFEASGKKVSKMRHYRNLRRSGEIKDPFASVKGKTYATAKDRIKDRAGIKKTINTYMDWNSKSYNDIAQRAGRRAARFDKSTGRAAKWSHRLNPFDPTGAIGLGGSLFLGMGPWSPAEALWSEDSSLYKGMANSSVWAPFQKNRGNPNRFTSNTSPT